MSDIKKTILAIFAHSDDELSVAGTLANHSERGDDVYLAFLTKGENSSTVIGNSDEIKQKREEHTRKISELLGVTIKFLDFPDSKIAHTVENGYKVAELIKEIRPNILISWTEFQRLGSGHPDHRNTSKLVLDAISYARYKNNNSPFDPYREIYSFYTYLNLHEKPSSQISYVDVTDQIEKIRKFIEIYKEAYGDWPVEDFKFGSMAYNGRLAGVKYAEAFEQVMTSGPAPKFLN